MEKRALLAVALSFFVLYFYMMYISPPQKPAEIQHIQNKSEVSEQAANNSENSSLSENTQVDTEKPDTQKVTQQNNDTDTKISEPQNWTATPASEKAREITVENNFYTAILTNRGAKLSRFTLKKYRDKVGKDSNPYEMIWQGQNGQLSPLTVLLQNPLLTKSFQSGFYSIQQPDEHIVLNNSRRKATFKFSRTDKNGVKLIKTITFHNDNYLVDVSISLINLTNKTINLTWTIIEGEGIGPEGKEKSRYIHAGPIFRINQNNKFKLKKVKTKNLKEGEKVFKSGVQWAASASAYFCTSLIPEKNSFMGVAWASKEEMPVVGLRKTLLAAKPLKENLYKMILFSGPKESNELKKAPHQLYSIIEYGFFHVIALPLFQFLLYLNGYIKSWGLTIIILTVMIKIVFYPLTRSSYQSMNKMKLIQPQMKEIRAKYKDDPTRMNKETWQLYKINKVNPMGGCLPMLLQIPVFFALYKDLIVSIELRHASFLYIPDLSSYDPYYISPILMGISMLLQQQMTPAMGDPKQAQVMKLMPIIFTVMFIYFPSGLVIYWLVNNVITIGQQYLISRKSNDNKVITEALETTKKKGKKKHA